MLFRICNYLHLRYHQSLTHFKARRSLIVLDNLWHLHHNSIFPEPKSPHCNYLALLKVGLLRRTKNKSSKILQGEYVDQVTHKGLRLLKPIMKREHTLCKYCIVSVLLIVSLFALSSGMNAATVKQELWALTLLFLICTILGSYIFSKSFYFLGYYTEVFKLQANKLNHMIK